MASITVLQPCITQVEINQLRDDGCQNFVGTIMETKVDCCCDTANQPCIKYLVRYMFRSCGDCAYDEKWFCPQDLTEIP